MIAQRRSRRDRQHLRPRCAMSRRRKPRASVADPLDQTRGYWDSSYLKYLLDDQSGWSHSVDAEAYYHAAKTLTRSLRRGRWGGMRRDGGIIPILFLWRHHLEISLKIIITDIADYKDAACPAIESTHDLIHLWGLAKKGLEEFVLDDAEMKAIERAVKSFSEFDPNSQAFRYPRSKGGQRAAPGLHLVETRGLDRAMTRVAKALEIARYGFDGLLYERDEARRSSEWY